MKKTKKYFIHLFLFITTVVFTTLSGIEWSVGKYPFSNISYTYSDLILGISFSFSFLGILTVHEFGHYFTARFHKVKTSLPYYIPLYFFGIGGMPSLGTMGAVIRIKDMISSKKKFFDIGIAGPLSGFIIALSILYYAFTHLRPHEYIFQIHPEYQIYGLDYPKYVYNNIGSMTIIGSSFLMEFFIHFVADPQKMPHINELMHYPLIMAGYFGCYFTALNLIPIGQLDGGHILYGLLGYRRSRKISLVLFILSMFLGGLDLFSLHQNLSMILIGGLLYITFLYFSMQRIHPNKMTILIIALSMFALQLLIKSYIPAVKGFPVLLVLGFFLGRFLGIYHPGTIEDQPLSLGRKILGWIALFIFVICFSVEPIKIIS